MVTGARPLQRSASRFAASYHREPGRYYSGRPRAQRPAPVRVVGVPMRERWAWFRIGVLIACWTWPRGTAALLERYGIDRDSSDGRVAWRNLALLVRGGYLARSDEGYLATKRGRRAIEDLRALGLDGAR